MNILVSPSLMCADLLHLADEIEALEQAGADMFHIDVMDGHFVSNFVFGEDIVNAVRRATTLPLDVHLVVYNPHMYIERFAQAGAAVITVHQEACENISSVIRMIKECGAAPSVAINPETSIKEIEGILSEISVVNVMGICPGFAGGTLIPATREKIKELRGVIQKKDIRLDIQIDGGVNRDTVSSIVDAGANVIIVGRQMLFSNPRDKYKDVITFLKGLPCG